MAAAGVSAFADGYCSQGTDICQDTTALGVCLCTLAKECDGGIEITQAECKAGALRIGSRKDAGDMIYADRCQEAVLAEIYHPNPGTPAAAADAAASKGTPESARTAANTGVAFAAANFPCVMFVASSSNLNEPDPPYGKVRKKATLWEEMIHLEQWTIHRLDADHPDFPSNGGAWVDYANALHNYFETAANMEVIDAIRNGKAGGTSGTGNDRDRTYQELKVNFEKYVKQLCDAIDALPPNPVPGSPEGNWQVIFNICKNVASAYKDGLPTTL